MTQAKGVEHDFSAGVLVLLMVLWSSLGHHIASRSETSTLFFQNLQRIVFTGFTDRMRVQALNAASMPNML